MTKKEYITKYGEEAWAKRIERTKLWQKINRESIREYQNQKNREFYARNKAKPAMKEFNANRREDFKSKMGDCAKFVHAQYTYYRLVHTKIESWVMYVLENLQKEATEFDGDQRFTDVNFLYERFVDNVNHNLIFGNIQIMKYLIPLMCIKVYNNETFTEHEIEMLKYFDSMEKIKHNPIKYHFVMIYVPREDRLNYSHAVKYMLLYNITAKFMFHGVIHQTDKKLF